uniref:Methyltransferase domain-containing protein n=1 Tax=Noctiluca scintillans TaxID=2966 RepID=A0A7S1A1K8_NOCSC
MALPCEEIPDGCYSNMGVWMDGGLAPWVPCNDDLVDEALSALQLWSGDYLVDLGCGEGKICRAAAERFGCRTMGVELDKAIVERALEKRNQMPERKHLVDIRYGDVNTMEWNEMPTCVTMFLLPEFYPKIEALLERFISAGAQLLVLKWELPGGRWRERVTEKNDGRFWIYRRC